MKTPWKFAVVLACVAVIFTVGVIWHRHDATSKAIKLAERGDPKAQHELALMYFYGNGVRQSFPEAAGWWRKAADQGYAKAQYNMGSDYYYGKGVQLDYADAMQWFKKAADQGDAEARCAIGWMYYYGQGVHQDYAEASRWYRKAADQGDAKAQYDLGMMLYYGKGVQLDRAEAARWYRRAADQGLAKAQYDLGYLYYYGQGVPPDRNEATHLFRSAADGGEQAAQRFLARKVSTLVKILFVTQALGGVILLLSVLGLGSPGARSREGRARLLFISAVGAFTVFCACLSWYGYTHYKVRTGAAGLNGFTVVLWILRAIMIAALLGVLFSGKKAQQQSS